MNTIDLSGVITPPTNYVPNNLIVKLVSLPKELLEDNVACNAFVNIIENHAIEIGPFSTAGEIRLLNNTVTDLASFEQVSVRFKEVAGKAITKTLRYIHQRYLTGKTLAELHANPFALVALEPDATRRHVVDAWLLSSFVFSSLPAISSYRSTKPQSDSIPEIHSFSLSSRVIQNDAVNKLAKAILDEYRIIPEGAEAEPSGYVEALREALPNANDIRPFLRHGYGEQIKDS